MTTACIAESVVVFLAGVFTTSEMALGLFVVVLLVATTLAAVAGVLVVTVPGSIVTDWVVGVSNGSVATLSVVLTGSSLIVAAVSVLGWLILAAKSSSSARIFCESDGFQCSGQFTVGFVSSAVRGRNAYHG